MQQRDSLSQMCPSMSPSTVATLPMSLNSTSSRTILDLLKAINAPLKARHRGEPRLHPGKWDSEEDILDKEARLGELRRTGYWEADHCSGSEHPVVSGRTALFVNAAIEPVGELSPSCREWLTLSSPLLRVSSRLEIHATKTVPTYHSQMFRVVQTAYLPILGR
jgi:hypothetical protein